MHQKEVAGTTSSTSQKGSKEAKELDELIDRVNCKFKQWKRAQISEKYFKQLDESKVENTGTACSAPEQRLLDARRSQSRHSELMCIVIS